MLERLQDYRAIKRERQQVEDYKARLLARYEELSDSEAAEMLEIEETIEHLDPTSRTLLRYRYIDGLTWQQIGDKMYYSLRAIHRLKDIALEELESIEPGD